MSSSPKDPKDAVRKHWANKSLGSAKKNEENQTEPKKSSERKIISAKRQAVEVIEVNSDSEVEVITEVSDKRPEKKKHKVSAIENEVVFNTQKVNDDIFLSNDINKSPIKTFYTPALPQKDAVRISSLFPNSIHKSYIFTMQTDLDFIIPQIMKNTSECPELYFVCDDLFGLDEFENKSEFKDRVHYVALNLDKGIHHSKMIINFHKINGQKEYMDIVVMTCNLTAAEFAFTGSCFWKSPLLPLKSESKIRENFNKRTNFQEDLLEYFQGYNVNLYGLPTEIAKYNFSSVCASFVFSYPIHNSTPYGQRAGFEKLREIVEDWELTTREDPNTRLKLLAHVSSLAGPFTYGGAFKNTWTHLISPILAGYYFYPIGGGERSYNTESKNSKFDSMILFPTKSDVINAAGNGVSGNYLFNYTNKDVSHGKFISSICYKRDIKSEKKGHLEGFKNTFLNNHAKVYTASTQYTTKKINNEDHISFDTLEWIMVGSFNLSQSAWGRPANQRGQYDPGKSKVTIYNYECGVVINRTHYLDVMGKEVLLKPTWNSDTLRETPPKIDYDRKDDETIYDLPIRLPYKFPIIKASPNEVYGSDNFDNVF